MNGYGKSLIFWALMLFVACAVLGVACGGDDDDVTPTSTPSTQSLEHIQVIVIQVIREKDPNAQISATQLDELAKQIAALQPKDDAQIRSFAELVIASGLANVPAPATTPASGAAGGSCQPGDKVATFPEGNNQHRIEVGGHGVQHVDFYPAPPIKAVSYIVQGIPNPDGIPAIWWGFGSIWEWNPPGCSYNFEKDATDYARARLDSGHSGLVIDLRGDKPRVVSKPDNMSQADVDRYLGYLKQGPGSNSTSSSSQQAAPAVVAPVYVAPPAQPAVQPAAPAAPAPSCDGVRQPDATRPDGPNSVWTIIGPAAANIWNPQVNNGAEEHILVPEGQTKTLTGYGGSWWKFPPGCAPK